MYRSLALLALVGSVGAQQEEILINSGDTVAAGTYRHYVGFARAARFEVDESQCTGATFTYRLAYAQRGNGTCAFNTGTGTCVDTTNNFNQCVTTTRNNVRVCVPVASVFPGDATNLNSGTNPTYFFSPTLTATGTPGFKAPGTGSFQWFVEYTTAAQVTNCQLRLIIGKSYDPTQAFCVGVNDTEWRGSDFTGYFAPQAGLPRSIGSNYIRDTVVVGSDTQAPSALQANPATIFGYWDLGRGPRVQLSCLQVYATPNVAPAAGCEPLQTGFGVNLAQWDMQLVSAPDCRNTANSVTCCALTTRATCQAQTQCTWVGFGSGTGATGECYLSSDMRFTDLASTGVVFNSADEFVFDSLETNGPTSSFINRPEEVENGWDVIANRRWFLRYTNRLVPTNQGATCAAAVTVSAISDTTGGICEPSTRMLCDTTEERCFANDLINQPRYWSQNERLENDLQNVVDLVRKDNYKTCNCLKQKEICYRKNGCLSAKRYELILQNCLEAGCGNFCNSGAQAFVSLAAVAVMVIGLLL